MDKLCVALITLFCAVSSSQDGISGSEVVLLVRPGDNITLYCDCRTSTGVSITWFRNCSHEHQPTLVISIQDSFRDPEKFENSQNPFPRFKLQWNPSNNTYDLLIENITGSDLGLYHCGTEETKLVDEGGKGGVKKKVLYLYGNVTNRLSFEVIPEVIQVTEDCGLCWILMFSLCPVSVLLSSLLSSFCVYSFCRKTAPNETSVPLNRTSTRGSDSREKEEEDLCYASLDIRQGQKRPKKKNKIQNSDFSTYSAINTMRV
ncbi:uncharacterized protein LOC114830624 [Esox lucius]|uniref:uncharacterized protein LOC114830624 n=1 Tax=Esox lucius TaxID=8010 RepID=UPI001477867A|nr:uncharacterized protein LOC114830624 [Esox lucius]